MADRPPAASDPPASPDPGPQAARRALATRIWGTVCRHIDGMAIGSTMAALASHGALGALAAADRTEFGKLRAGLGARAGFLHVAIRLLADQGWVTCAGEGGTDELSIAPTPGGRVVMTRLADGYAAAARFLPLAGRAAADPAAGDAALEPFLEAARRDWGLPVTGVPADVRRQVLAHLNGHLVAPVMFGVTRENRLPGGPAAEILARQGWVRTDGGAVRLTAAGEMAVTLARQYRYPMVYLPLLRSVPELIFGDPVSAGAAGDEDETHLDRGLDIRFSGEVFAATCRAPFLDVALPLFDREPLAGQPALVVDMGCGDGTLLETLYGAVRTRTARGPRLGEYPLLMVGADPSPVARRAAAARLSAAGVPHHLMDGDIADPSRLARELAAAGYDARNALHVCKSAIHDRAYRSPGLPGSPPGPVGTPPVPVPAAASSPGPPPAATTAFARPDGSAIPAPALALDLAELFRSWRPLTRRHGWIVIEAHSVRSATVAALIGRTLATALDATHGYSCQYPVEPEVFAWAARAGGFTSRAHREPAARALGHTQLTIDHFEVDAANGDAPAGNCGPE
jgi:hypothetical protein